MNDDFNLETPIPPKCDVCGNELVIVNNVEMLYGCAFECDESVNPNEDIKRYIRENKCRK